EVLRVLRSEGVFILETVNPHAVDAFRSFWLDLTHVRPLFPEAMLVLAGEAGFPRGEIMFPRGSGDLETDLDEQGAYALAAWAPGGGDCPTSRQPIAASAVPSSATRPTQ